ncbi:rod shape-determining protein MreD [Acidocella aromatica]|uniref:Rod shape-determining protein MreD n=1 Tax=Acidocella aromatica TaxID=1303579 RepID=A0A840VR87_9PROT|nr:rod shape-determining protein MreD [Acidocella aromatica]MBB5373880.1 rod shape-determining protein MreD [Acidocella aromatica]
MVQGPALRRPLTLWRRLDTASRWAFPGFMLVLGLIVIGMPFGLPNQAALRPVYAMACVYFWSLYRPASLPTPLVALCGVLLDLLGLSPLGLWAVILLLLQLATIAARRRLAPARFIVTWGAFTGFAIIAAGLAWAAQSLLELRLLPATPVLWESLFAAGLYPLLARLLIRAHRTAAAVELA